MIVAILLTAFAFVVVALALMAVGVLALIEDQPHWSKQRDPRFPPLSELPPISIDPVLELEYRRRPAIGPGEIPELEPGEPQ